MTGFEVAERLRAQFQVDVILGDRRRITAMATHGDDEESLKRLVRGLRKIAAEPSHDPARRIELPPLADFEHELAMLPRTAYFGRTEQVPAHAAVGRIVAELVSPYPPGIPVLLPGERINQGMVDYLTSGAAAGFLIPDAADPQLKSLRVVVENATG